MSENSGGGVTGADQTREDLVNPDSTGTNKSWSQTSKSKSFSYTAKESAWSMLDQQMLQLFGRRATAKEKSTFYKSLHSLEKKYATTSKGKTSGAGNSSRQTSTSKGYSFSAPDQAFEFAVSLATDIIKSGKDLGGKAGETYNALKTYADDMGVTFNESTGIRDTLNSIKGKTDETRLKEDYRSRAISLYGGLSERLTKNPQLTVRQAASDYINTMAQMLDINPESVSLFDNTLSKALTATKDNKPYTKTLNEFRADLRADNRFQYSTMAHQEAANLGASLAKSFGFGV